MGDSVPNFFGGQGGGASGLSFGGGASFGADAGPLFEMKCGKLVRDGAKMRADPRRGTLKIAKSEVDDTLKQIQWGVRDPSTAFEAEDDFIILPDEAVLKTMKRDGCFMLAFIEERDRDMYFWSQESDGKDAMEAKLLKFNRAVNTNVGEALEENIAASEAQTAMETGDAPNAVPSETPAATTLMPPPANVIPSPVDPTPAPTSFPAQTPAAPAKVSEGMRTPASAGNFTPIVSSDALKGVFASLGGATPQTPPVGLPEILTPELVGPLLRDEQIRGRLLEYLPEEHRETQDLEELIRTPQFRSQLETFSQALQSGEMDMAQFGLKQNGVANLETFLKAIQAEVDESSGKNEEEDAMES